MRIAIEKIFPTPDHHSNLCSPIADVIIANHVVSEKARDSRERIAERGAPNVPDVHRLGYIWRTKIDHDFFWRFQPCNTEPLIRKNVGSFLFNCIAAQFEID